jgi:hypothetical protein
MSDSDLIGDEPNHVKTRRRREARVDHVFEIPFNQPEKPEVTCPDCEESIEVGIYGVCEISYDICWGLDCDAYHKFRRDRDAETYAEEASTESESTVQTTLVTDGGVDRFEDLELVVEFTQRFTVKPPEDIDDPVHAEDWFWNICSDIGWDAVDVRRKKHYDVVDVRERDSDE